jgi:predicted nucleic acid-binding protein
VTLTTKTIRFLDSSAFVKMFVDELGSDSLRGLLSAIEDTEKIISILAQVEATSAIQRRFRNRELSLDSFRAAAAELVDIGTRWPRIPIDEFVLETAFGIITRHSLRSLDALQLASAVTFRQGLASYEQDLLFIACDKRLLTAATAERLTVWNPETSPIPPVPPVN